MTPQCQAQWSRLSHTQLFIATALVLGLLISIFAHTQFQAVQLSVFTFLQAILLSGFMFPFDRMPQPAQWFGEPLPLTHFVHLVRSIVLRGTALDALSPDAYPFWRFFS